MKNLLLLTFFFTALNVFSQEKSSFKAKPKLAPDHLKLQFAGSIGMVSAGTGYNFMNGDLDLDIIYGYVPKSVGSVETHIFTLKGTKQVSRPIQMKNNYSFHPFSFGFFGSYNPGKQFFLRHPDKYPRNYYEYPTAMVLGTFIGGKLNKGFSEQQHINQVSLYYELGTTDLEVASFITNYKTITPLDIFSLGLGLKFNFE